MTEVNLMYSQLAVQSEKWGVEDEVELHKNSFKWKKKGTKTKTWTEKKVVVVVEWRCGNETHAGGESTSTGEVC